MSPAEAIRAISETVDGEPLFQARVQVIPEADPDGEDGLPPYLAQYRPDYQSNHKARSRCCRNCGWDVPWSSKKEFFACPRCGSSLV